MAERYTSAFNAASSDLGSLAAPGYVISGGPGLARANHVKSRSASGIVTNRAGLKTWDPSVTVEMTKETIALLLKGHRATGSGGFGAIAEDLKVSAGDEGKGTNGTAAIVDGYELSWESGPDAVVGATMNFKCRKPVADTNGVTQVEPATGVRYGQNAITLTIATGSYKCVGFRLGVQNNVEYRSWGDGPVVGEEPFYQGYRWGLEVLSLTTDIEVPYDYDPLATTPAHNIAVALTLDNGETGGDIAYAFANLGIDQPPLDISVTTDGPRRYSIEWKVDEGTLTVSQGA